MKRLMILISALLVFASCKEVFESPPYSLIQATIMNSSTGIQENVTVTVKGKGLETDLYKDSTLSVVMLPLSSNDTTTYIITFDSVTDEISFVHTSTLQYESMESGFYYEHKLISIAHTHHRIDLIQITDSLVTQNWHENIKLYLRPLPVGGN